MEGDQGNHIKGTPIWEFVQDKWIDWVPSFTNSKIEEDEFLLLLMWGIDSLKMYDENIYSQYRQKVFRHLRARLIKVNDSLDDIEFTTNLICACSLYCFGLTLIDYRENQEIFCKVISGLDKTDWQNIKEIKDKINSDSGTQHLKEWMLEYITSEEYYTYSDEIEWSDESMQILPAVPNVGLATVKIETARIETLVNQSGGNIIDGSTIINITRGNDDSKTLTE